MERIEFERCPWCGSLARFIQTSFGACPPVSIDHGSFKLSFTIKCSRCGASAPGSSGFIAMNLLDSGELNIWHDDRQKAANAWNKRAYQMEIGG